MSIQIMNRYLFLKRCENLSEKTLKDYREILTPFCKNIDVEKCTTKEIFIYFDKLLSRGISPASYATYLRTIKIFLRWYSNESEVNFNVSKIRIPKTPKQQVYVYTDSDIDYLFRTINSAEAWIALRNKAIIALMLDSGLRRSEVTKLRKSDINAKDRYISVTGKGNKRRVVPFGHTSETYIALYLDACPYQSQFLFIDRRGDNISVNAVKQLIQKLKPLLPFEFSAHKLRHNFATNYCLDQYEKYGQVDIYKLMHLLGHENIETTRLYLHYAYDILAAQNSISHLDKLRI